MYKKLVIGIDQSYTKTGVAIAADGKLLKLASIPFRGCKIKSEKRKMLRQVLTRIIKLNTSKASETLVICERIRTFSVGKDGRPQISTSYMTATGALIATIVDTAFEFGIPVYSVDTKSWKTQVVGSTKAVRGDKKLLTIRFVKKLGFGDQITRKNRKGRIVYDDDAADAACIALYGFCKHQKLRQEQ